jgi:sec-independent protein translocase protein TatA
MRIGPLGVWELLIILVVVLLIFGPRRLPEMARGIGQSVREFRKGIRDMKDDFDSEVSKDDKRAGTVTTTAAPTTPTTTTLEADSVEAERLRLREEEARLRAEQEALRVEREALKVERERQGI